ADGLLADLLMESMMADDMSAVVASERERLSKERSGIQAKMSELQSQLAEVDHKMGAIEAFEKALNSKTAARAMPGRRQGGKRAGRGEKQAQVFKGVEAAAKGAT